MSANRYARARIHIDPCHERGRVCRGAYVVDHTGAWYMRHDGSWSYGACHDDNWWDTAQEAMDALRHHRQQHRNINKLLGAAS